MAMGGAPDAFTASASVPGLASPEFGPGPTPSSAGIDPTGFQSPPRETLPDADAPKRLTSARDPIAAGGGRGRGGGGKGRGRPEDESTEAPLAKKPKPTAAEKEKDKELSEKTKELTNELSEMSRKETSYQGSLARALSKAAQAERREVRERLRRDSLRLGTFSRGLYGRGAERDAALTWQGGTDWEEVELLRKRIQEQKQQVEKLQQTIKTLQKQTKKSGEQTQTAEELEEDLWEQRELCLAKSEALKREESDLKERERRLHIDRLEHVRQFRSIESEDQMSFGDFPPLLKRYSLLRLQDKAASGNTDVYQAYDVHKCWPCLVKIHSLSQEPTSKVSRLEAIKKQCEAFQVGVPKERGFASLLDHFELEGGSKYVMVWEYCEGEPWDTFILRNAPVMEKEARGFVLQLLGALRAAEKCGFQLFHLDFKPSRLTFRGGEVKINSARFPQLRNKSRSRTRSNMELPSDSPVALESQEADDDLDAASQVIRVAGSIFYELLFGRSPEQPASPGDREVELPDNPKISPECRECLCRMFNREMRATVQDIYSDKFFAPSKRR